jgi:hypothetical protein
MDENYLNYHTVCVRLLTLATLSTHATRRRSPEADLHAAVLHTMFPAKLYDRQPVHLGMQSGCVMHACECLVPDGCDCVMRSLHPYVARHPYEIMSENKWITRLWTACWF